MLLLATSAVMRTFCNAGFWAPPEPLPNEPRLLSLPPPGRLAAAARPVPAAAPVPGVPGAPGVVEPKPVLPVLVPYPSRPRLDPDELPNPELPKPLPDPPRPLPLPNPDDDEDSPPPGAIWLAAVSMPPPPPPRPVINSVRSAVTCFALP